MTLCDHQVICSRFGKVTIEYDTVFSGRKEGNVLFNDALNTFYLRLYGIRYMVKDHLHGLLFRLAARVLLKASFHRQDSTSHSLCYTSRGELAGTRNSSIGSP